MEERRVVLVTGGGAGIGRAIALRFGEDGYRVAVNGRRAENTKETADLIRSAGGAAAPFMADVSVEEEARRLVEKTAETYGRLDVLVNCAGICPIRPFEEVTPEDFERTIRVNLFSMFYCVHAAVPYLRKTTGKILNAGSQSSFRQSPETVEYATSKWAVRGLTRTLAAALAEDGITVNAFCPGTVLSPMQLSIAAERGRREGITVEEYYKRRYKEIPLHRAQPAEEVAALVAFLASKAADNITGQCIMINGGQVMC